MSNHHLFHVPVELVHFLSYVGHSEDPDSPVIKDDFVELLDQRIAAIKRERNWEARYMQFREMLRDERAPAKPSCLLVRVQESESGVKIRKKVLKCTSCIVYTGKDKIPCLREERTTRKFTEADIFSGMGG